MLFNNNQQSLITR